MTNIKLNVLPCDRNKESEKKKKTLENNKNWYSLFTGSKESAYLLMLI